MVAGRIVSFTAVIIACSERDAMRRRGKAAQASKYSGERCRSNVGSTHVVERQG
jgi:hypothetical protein